MPYQESKLDNNPTDRRFLMGAAEELAFSDGRAAGCCGC